MKAKTYGQWEDVSSADGRLKGQFRIEGDMMRVQLGAESKLARPGAAPRSTAAIILHELEREART